MKRVGLAVLCFAVLVALAAPIASASAAEPIFEKVIVVPIKEGEKIPFTTTGGKSTLSTVEAQKITCLSSVGSGSINGPTGVSLSVTFKGCEGFAAKCTTSGAAEGEVITNGFEGKLGNLKSESTPGIALTGLKEIDAEFTCGTTAVKLSGGVVGPITNVGVVVSKLTLTYKATAGVQLFESLFGGPLDTLSLAVGANKPVHAGLTSKIVLKVNEAVEIT